MRVTKMGTIKIDIKKKDREWKYVNLGEIQSIRGLLKFRSKFDILHGADSARYNTDSDLYEFSEEIICTYISLDELISKCIFNKKQKDILELYMQGSTEEEIADELNLIRQNVNGIIESICKKISDEFHESWVDNMYWNYIPIKHNYKLCSKCKKSFPATEKYFSPKQDNADGFQSFCKKCDANRKKI